MFFATLLATAVTIAMFVTTAAVTTAEAAALFAWLWFVVPMIRRGRLDDESLSMDGHSAGVPSRRRR